ncbi:hypothetical protein F8M41_019922 [Gigaspora margarita]|uniref:Uncharacterized protein n=1 Tax=Gigaspora margarita TaxID=4874 RepID=A0A8H4B207_GIGMA|nr:hypothetical protein F8M41_019922 [Gigaspora margarita]
MDQKNSSTFQYESEVTFNNILEYNFTSIEFSLPLRSFEYFISNLEYSTSPSYVSDSISTRPLESSSIHNFEYIASSPNLEYSTSLIYASKYSSSQNSEQSNFEDSTVIYDTFDYSDSSNI